MTGRRSGTTLDEVAVLSSIGAWAGRALGTAVREVRRAAVTTTTTAASTGAQLAVAGGRALRRGRARSRGAATRATTELAHHATELVAQVGPATDDVRRELAGVIAPRHRRRWPWVLGAVGVAGAGAAALALRRPVAAPPAPQPPRIEDVRATQETEQP